MHILSYISFINTVIPSYMTVNVVTWGKLCVLPNELEQACISYSTESSSGLVQFDSNWQRIFVTAPTFLLDQAIPV